ncbi:MAG TPA: formylglycine-generating enzyme family protein [Polyangiaceae bacterium]|jgi:formylglycine-generating enzyme required for sulfatase activity|nr:formylglycine-generating enzyme family protein [Polyangiaceae bacterium]
MRLFRSGIAVLAATSGCYFLYDYSGISDGEGGVMDASPPDACPSGRGPAMVALPGYCIDSTEVTIAQYNDFIDAGPDAAALAACGSTSFIPVAPAAWPPDASSGNLPVAGIDWCAASAFCAWSGKRLCGKIGGGSLDIAAMNDPSQSQWFAACSRGGTRAYPYGNSFQAGTCNDNTTSNKIAPVESYDACVGGFPGIFDMSGNVAEWEDACDAGACLVRGGEFNNNSNTFFPCGHQVLVVQNMTSVDKGIRCCSP